MKISNIELTNFRNHSKLSLSFSPNINIIVGDNGCGKTNVVESIYFTSYLKSYRVTKSSDLINFNSDFSKIVINTLDKYEIILAKNTKKCSKNGNLIKKQSEFLGDLKVVIFSPETIDLLLKSPSERRKYLDFLICMYNPTFIHTLKEYNHVIKQRSDYLKQMMINNLADKTYLDVLDDKYVEISTKIFIARKELIERINFYANTYFKNFFDFTFNISYETQTGIDLNNISPSLTTLLKKRFERELYLGQTTTGPSRDDIVFNVDGHNAKYFCSKGQQRIVLISLKLAEIAIIKEFSSKNPILILDDVLSELDHKRQQYLFDVLETMDIQTLVTTTDVDDVSSLVKFNKIEL